MTLLPGTCLSVAVRSQFHDAELELTVGDVMRDRDGGMIRVIRCRVDESGHGRILVSREGHREEFYAMDILGWVLSGRWQI